ncbi:protein TBATA isoform X2 [Callorhinchus milii]|uniref:protein TBATA isoform X2 n=1 Tax=Callorhinchus milii TaxID=7868 RepID=UPI00045716D8|nr:protein TBATA isoform X2 [Callorhinchus milii]|eukprot:gi/632972731/ref/XP_007902803.1/ PREDICTED: protein TBATA-like isoform X2 [Callorhinchus milii]
MERLGRPVTYPFKFRPTRKPGTVTLNSPLRSSAEAERPQSKSTSRFGVLSHHSFFSRHNPHPQRVTHINGLNGMPVCTVNDDWYVNAPLSPHPLIKRQLTTTVLGMPGTRLPISIFQRNGMSDGRAPMFATAWREELRDFASKACLLIPKETEEIKEPEVRRSTQYSAQTGRLIPPSSRTGTGQACCRASKHHAGNKNKYTSPFQDQELLVLDLLCQLLQTDSLSAVQQWLLSSAQREKDFVLGMVQSTLANSLHDYQHITDRAEVRLNSQMNCNPLAPEHKTCNINRNKHDGYYLKKKPERIEEEEPDHIGTAEVLQIHRNESPRLNNEPQNITESNQTTGNN